MAAKDSVFLDTDVVLDHLADRRPFAEHAHRLFALAETGALDASVSALTFSHVSYLLRKGRTPAEVLALLAKLRRLVRILPVGEREIAAALASRFADFEDAVQHASATGAIGITAIITRNKPDYTASELPVMTPDEYLAVREVGPPS